MYPKSSMEASSVMEDISRERKGLSPPARRYRVFIRQRAIIGTLRAVLSFPSLPKSLRVKLETRFHQNGAQELRVALQTSSVPYEWIRNREFCANIGQPCLLSDCVSAFRALWAPKECKSVEQPRLIAQKRCSSAYYIIICHRWNQSQG